MIVWSTPHRRNEEKNHNRSRMIGPPSPRFKSKIRETRFGARSPVAASSSVKLSLCQSPGTWDQNADPLKTLLPSFGIMFRRTPDDCTSAVSPLVW